MQAEPVQWGTMLSMRRGCKSGGPCLLGGFPTADNETTIGMQMVRLEGNPGEY